MRRNALTGLDSLDLDVREAAEAAARRSGMSLEDWIATNVAERAAPRTPPASRKPRRRPGDDIEAAIAKIAKATRQRPNQALESIIAAAAGDERPAEHSARTAVALDSVASWIERAEERLNAATRSTADQQSRLAAALSEALDAIRDRLDAVERDIVSERDSRARRQEMPVIDDAFAALKRDMTDLIGRIESRREQAWAPAVEEIREDISRLQTSVRGLATRDEVSGLEETVRSLSDTLTQARSNDDVLTLAGSVADLQRQIEQVSMEAAEGVQQRISAEMDDLRRRIDQVASRGTDRAVIDGLTKQLDEMRQFVERIAEPQRVERLAEEVGTLGRLMAEMRLNQIGRNDFANLKSALEDIRTALKRSEDEKAASAIPEQLRSLSQRVDQLVNRPQPAGAEPVRDQMTALADKLSRLAAERTKQADAVTGFMERISGQVSAVSDRLAAPPEAVMERLDRIEDGLRQVGRDSDTAQIELMLRSVQERLDRAPMSAGSLEGLERQIEALTGRLTDFGEGEPLRQVVTETLAQVKSLRDQAGEIAERAVKAALKEVRGAGAPQSAADLEAVKQGFAELKALQASADRKTQQTLKAVHNALETLVLRAPAPLQNVTWGGPAQDGAGEGGEPPAAIRLEAAVRRLHAAAISHVEEVTSSAGTEEPKNEQSEAEEVLIEPGMPRLAPPQPAASFTAAPDAEPAHVRANFIAAARRAVLAAQGDRRAAAGDEPASSGPAEEPETGERAISNQTLIERIRQTFDAHRRPLLLSLALLILAAGTAQIVGTTSQEDALATPTVSMETAPETKPEPVSTAAESSDAGKATETAEVAPDVTGSLLQPKALAAPATGGVSAFSRRVADVAAGDLPAALPPSLRDAALIGDPAAVFEVAARLAEGRDVKQDPALAARLFEKVAETGLAPAQYRIGNIYEKGFGVPRDPVAAKGWYERAAETGNARAMHNLGVLLAEGVGGKPDYAAAQRWFLSAAEHGVKDSQYNLGVLLARGLGVAQDLGQSYKWFALAANQGDQEAAKKRDEVALRLAPADLAAAKASVAGWQAKAGDAAANEIPPPPQGWSSLSGASKRS